MDIYWDGILGEEGISDKGLHLIHTFADSCRDQDWGLVFLFVEKYKPYSGLINATRPGGRTLNTPLHYAALGGAAPDVIRRLIELGALRSLRNANGERPVDLARRNGHDHLIGELTPVMRHPVPAPVLSELEASFHDVIRERFVDFRVEQPLRLPLLEPLLELKKPQMCFYVPEMWGGFFYRLKRAGAKPVLISESILFTVPA